MTRDRQVLLDANEASVVLFNDLEDFIKFDRLNRYPDSLQTELREKLASVCRVDSSEVLSGNGSDELIDLLIRAFGVPGEDCIMICSPTFGMYGVAARLSGLSIIDIPLDENFNIMSDKFHAALQKHRPKLIFICSPNNPTGNYVSLDFIADLCKEYEHGLVVIDEAYIDFCRFPSAVELLDSYPQLIVLRTLSKAFGLAGIRVGYMIAASDIIDALISIKMPYNLNSLSISVALRALDCLKEKEKYVQSIVATRDLFVKKITPLECVVKTYPSEGNFVLVKLVDAEHVQRQLLNNNVIVRNRNNDLNCENCLRISIGLPDEMERVIDVMSKITPSPTVT